MVRNKRIVNILKKERKVISGDINSLLFVTLLPLLIVGELILAIWLINSFASEAMAAHPIFQNTLDKVRTALPVLSGYPVNEQLQVMLLSQFNFFLLLIPTMIAISFTTFSIVDEKLSGSLEALLATPVRTWELLLGKALSGAIPAFIITCICAGIFILAIIGLGWGKLVGIVINPSWYISLLLLTPVVALLSFLLGIIGSSRAKDTKSAQNMALFIIFPVLILIGVQVTGLVWFNTLLIIVLVLGIGVVDLLVLRGAVGLFQRESIVVRWR